jgi:hypothetical protein
MASSDPRGSAYVWRVVRDATVRLSSEAERASEVALDAAAELVRRLPRIPIEEIDPKKAGLASWASSTIFARALVHLRDVDLAQFQVFEHEGRVCTGAFVHAGHAGATWYMVRLAI